MSDVMLPDLTVQKRILEAKRDQLRAQAFEANLDAALYDTQTPLLEDGREREKVRAAAAERRRQARILYTAAAECQRQLDTLPEAKEEG